MAAPDVPIHILVLAAGSSTRFGTTDKLLTPIAGRSLLSWTLQTVAEQLGDTDLCTVVVGPGSGTPARLAASFGMRSAYAPDARQGIRYSIAAGLGAAGEQGAGGAAGVAIVLGDDPLAARRLDEVLARAREAGDAAVAIRRASGTPHPVYLPAARLEAAREIPASDADRGLRALIGDDATWLAHPDDVTLDVDVPADAARLAALLA